MNGHVNRWLNNFGLFLTGYTTLSVMIYSIERLV